MIMDILHPTKHCSVASTILTLAAIAAFWQLKVYAPLLPSEIAVDFNVSGEPGKYVSSHSFITWNFFLNTIFLAIPLLFRFFANQIPEKFIYMPNKEYWLEESRREIAHIRLTRYLKLFFGMTLIYNTALNQYIFDASIHAGEGYNPFYQLWITLGYCAAVILQLVLLFWEFRVKDFEKEHQS